MKRAIATALVILGTLTMSGCYERVDTVDKMKERAAIRDECESLRGKFIEWRNELGDQWRCEFDSEDSR